MNKKKIFFYYDLFVHQATFHKNDYVKCHNSYYHRTRNSYNTKRKRWLNVCAKIDENCMASPYSYTFTVNGPIYLRLLKERKRKNISPQLFVKDYYVYYHKANIHH